MVAVESDRVQYRDQPGLGVSEVLVDGRFWGLVVSTQLGPWAGKYELHRWHGQVFQLLAEHSSLVVIDNVIRTEVGCP